MKFFKLTSMAAASVLAMASIANAGERLTLKSASSTSAYYVMMVQLGEMMKSAHDYSPTVEESQGSVQNVTESRVRQGNFLFTTPPSLLDDARNGREPFNAAFDTARTLFPMPFVTIHFVAREDAGITSLSELKDVSFIAGGVGSWCEGRTMAVLDALKLGTGLNVVEVEEEAAAPALRNNQVAAFSSCESHPAPALVELGTTTPFTLLSLSEEERETVVGLDPMSGRITIAGGTYKGQDAPVDTVAVPVGAYGTVNMTDDVAYQITKTFWENKDALAGDQPWWNGVTPALVQELGAELHPGAARYYQEIGVSTN